MREPTSVADLLSARLLRLSNTLGLYAGRRYRDQFGVSLPEWRVMSIIAQSDETTARDVSRVLTTDKGWVGRSVEKLWRRGYVSRSADENDSRRMLLRLTGQGRTMHDAILSVARERQQRLLAVFPEGEAARFVAGLDRLQAEADRMVDEFSEGPVRSRSTPTS